MSRNLNLHTAAGVCHFQHHYLQCCSKYKYSVAVYLLKAPAHTDKHELIFQYTSQTIKYWQNFVAVYPAVPLAAYSWLPILAVWTTAAATLENLISTRFYRMFWFAKQGSQQHVAAQFLFIHRSSSSVLDFSVEKVFILRGACMWKGKNGVKNERKWRRKPE